MKIKSWQIITVITSIILGVVLHYLYELLGENKIIGIFSAVNESIWEHLKLIFYPLFLMSIIGKFVIGKKSNNYWTANTLGIIAATIFTVVFYYTYTGVIGKNIDTLNIGIFVISIILSGFITYKLLISNKYYNSEKSSIMFLIILIFSFTLYTFNPPQISLFKDPIFNNYGIYERK